MSKHTRSKGKSDRKAKQLSEELPGLPGDVIVDLSTYSARQRRRQDDSSSFSLISARNQAQGQYLSAIKTHQLVFGLGPAGTGKTYCAAAMAAEALASSRVRHVVFCRPAVESGEHLGFLPGKIMDKVDPWFSIFRSYLSDLLGRGVVDCALKNGRLSFEALAYMRGKTFDDSFVIMDEAQNCTHAQLKMFLTRIGERTRVVVNGDVQQSDIGERSGLAAVARLLNGLADVHVHKFSASDVVRSNLVKRILERYAAT
jgi:phosphate starvation-inducible PhoH-like protein